MTDPRSEFWRLVGNAMSATTVAKRSEALEELDRFASPLLSIAQSILNDRYEDLDEQINTYMNDITVRA